MSTSRVYDIHVLYRLKYLIFPIIKYLSAFSYKTLPCDIIWRSFTVQMVSSGEVLEEQVDQDYNLHSVSNKMTSTELKNFSTWWVFQLEEVKCFNIEKAQECLILFIYMYAPNQNHKKQVENLWSRPLSMILNTGLVQPIEFLPCSLYYFT